jgi:hypothetical protein
MTIDKDIQTLEKKVTLKVSPITQEAMEMIALYRKIILKQSYKISELNDRLVEIKSILSKNCLL